MQFGGQKFLVTAIGLAVLCAIAWMAWPTRQKPTAFEKVAADFVKLSLPDDGAVAQTMVVTRETWQSTATWEFETQREWKAYTDWLATKLGTEFHKTVDDELVVEFRKTQPSEIVIVRSECGPDDQPRRTRMSLIVMPW
ncbi:MAG: hypothetical protein HZA46_04775 [Planctomycetales bacterium]|nr:hypothetical protein [Planctomycetales bacterium]